MTSRVRGSADPSRAMTATLLRSDLCLDLLRLDRAELEFRDLAERIERRIGQQVRRRLGVAERHEHHVLRHVAIGAYLDLDGAAAGLQADEIAGPHIELAHVLWRHE